MDERKGRRVRLVSMNSECSMQTGEMGTVDFTDDAGTVHCTWDNGSCLGLIPGIDQWEWIDG